jgi:hypothetical protein
MNKSNPGFALPKVFVALAVLLMAAVLALKIVENRNSAKFNAQPEQAAVPVVAETEIGQPLPEEARTQSSLPFAADSAAVPPTGGGNSIVPADVPEEECLRVFKRDPAALLRQLMGDHDSAFTALNGFRDDPELSGLFSDYAVCSILIGADVTCTNDFRHFCGRALSLEFINSSLHNRPDDGKCSQFVNQVLRKSGVAVSPGFCGVVAAALTRRTAPDCEKLGNIEGCSGVFLFLKGRQACSALTREEKKDCLLNATLASGETSSSEAWLPKAMSSRSKAACVSLGEKFAVSYCTSKLRRKLLTDLRAIKASEAKTKVLDERRKLNTKKKVLKKD